MHLTAPGDPAPDDSLATMVDFLCAIPMFNGLKTSELRVIAGYMNSFEAEPGDAVFLEGELGDYVCFVAEGKLEVSKASSDGTRRVLTTLQQGQSIGEMAVIDNAPRSATVVVAERARLLTLARQDFETLLQEHPAMGISILKGIARLLSQNLRRTSGLLAERMLPVL